MSKTKQPAKAFARKQSVIATGFALSLMAAQSVYAQQTAAPADAAQKAEKIEVTGTRIPPPNLEGASPVTVIDAQSIKVDGVRSVENLLNNLPQVVADQGGNVSNGATGTATVNLRNLGADRTLVLVNGRRLPPGSPRAFASDLNQIAAPLIKRVEVLTGGAGAVYGSDAVAGVINFIMNDKFEGAQFEVNQSFYNHQQNGGPVADMIRARALSNPGNFNVPDDKSSDGKIFDMSMLLGGNFGNGKGNATVFFNYKKENALLQSERDFSACSIGNSTSTVNNTINGVAFGPGFRCGGSGTSFPGRFFVATPGQRTVANSAGNTRAYVAANDQYNFGPLNYFQRPSERYGFNASLNYDISENIKVYSEFSFHDDRTVAQIAPSGLFGFDASGSNAIHFDNPLLSADWKRDLGFTSSSVATDTAEALIFRRNVEGGGRQDDIRHTSYRSVVGVKGDFMKHWNYDLFAQTGKVVYQETYKNDFSIARTALALDAVRDATGNIVCRSGAPGCVPYNIWALGGVTPAAVAYLSTPGFQKGFTDQTVQGGTVSVDLGNYGWKMPSAKNGIGFAFGLERRTEELDLSTDSAFTTGDLAGQGGPTLSLGGGYTVKEIFAEVRLPLIEGAQFADYLSVNGSYRHSDYSTDQKTDSYGAGIEWAHIKEVRTRASYQRAARAANVIELFQAAQLGLFDMDEDPCGPAKTATAAQCARTGVTAAQYGSDILDSPAGQYNALFGGEKRLTPEKSDSNTVGIVFTPWKNFSASLDYFQIKVDKLIGSPPAGTTLNQCLLTGAAAFCNKITRDRLGTLWALPTAQIDAINKNLGTSQTSGLDIGINYAHKIQGYGGMKYEFIGTYVREFKVEIPGLGQYDCIGLHGGTCGAPQPEWRHKMRGTWETPWSVDFSFTWRHIGKVNQEGTSSNPILATDVAGADRTFSERNYFDLAGSWAITKKITLRGGVNNLLDKDPPLSGLVGAGFGNGNTYPQVYDALGRRVFVNLTATF